MDFFEFANILYRYIGNDNTQPEFVKSLFEKILSTENLEEYDCACSIKDDSNRIYKALNRSRSGYQKIYAGERGITSIARVVFPCADSESFTSIFEEISYEAMENLLNEFREAIPDIDHSNAATKIGELFIKILKENTSPERKKTNISSSKETSVASNRQKAETFPIPNEPISTETSCDEPVSAETSSEESSIAISKEPLSDNESPFASFEKDPYLNFSVEDLMHDLDPNDLTLLEEFKSDYDSLLEECIKTHFTVSADEFLWERIHYLKIDRWDYKAINFKNCSLQKLAYEIINTLDNLNDYLTCEYMNVIPNFLIPRKTHLHKGFPVHDVLSKETTRIKNHLRILYIALHPGAINAPVFSDLKPLYLSRQNSDKFPTKES